MFSSKKYFNLTKIFVLRLFKIAANPSEYSGLQQRSATKLFMVEISKLRKIYNRMSDVLGEIYFRKKKKKKENCLQMG